MFCGFPYRTVIACRVAQETRGRLKSPTASMFLGDCHTNGRSLQPYPIGSPSDLWQILNLCDVEAKELNFQIRGDSETSFQSKPQKNFSQKGAGPGRWTQTSLSLTFHRRQSLTRERRLKKNMHQVSALIHFKPERIESNCSPSWSSLLSHGIEVVHTLHYLPS